MQATFFKEGPITIDNKGHEEFTMVTINVALEVEGALLKVASALTNSGCSIQEGGVEVAPVASCLTVMWILGYCLRKGLTPQVTNPTASRILQQNPAQCEDSRHSDRV